MTWLKRGLSPSASCIHYSAGRSNWCNQNRWVTFSPRNNHNKKIEMWDYLLAFFGLHLKYSVISVPGSRPREPSIGVKLACNYWSRHIRLQGPCQIPVIKINLDIPSNNWCLTSTVFSQQIHKNVHIVAMSLCSRKQDFLVWFLPTNSQQTSFLPSIL